MNARRVLARAMAAILGVVLVGTGLVGLPVSNAQPPSDSGESVTAAGSTPPIITGWLPHWTIANSTSSYLSNSDMFTDVSPFWLSTKKDTRRTSAVMPILQVDRAIHDDVVARLRAAGKPVIPAITDGTPARHMASVLADPVKRASHVRELLFIATVYGYDGIDLDYEQFAFADGTESWASTRPNWVAFVEELTAAFHAKGLKVTVSIPTSGYWVYDFAAMGRIVDSVRIMTYDWSVSKPGPIAPIWWVQQEIAKMRAVIPAEKLMIGVPVYGRDWHSRTISGTCTDSLALNTRAITAKETPTITSKPGAVVQRDATAGEVKVTYQQTFGSCRVERVAWLADEQTVAQRVQAAIDGGARGAALWTVGGENPSQQWPLLRSIAASIPPPPPPPPAPVPAGQTIRVPTGKPNQNVIGMLSAVSPAANGHLTAFSCDQPLPDFSSLNYQTGRTTPNTVTVRTNADGEFCVYTLAATDVLFDQVAEAPSFDTSAPARIRDTALDKMAVEGRQGPVPAQGTIEIDTGRPNALVIGNLTVAGPETSGHTSAWPCAEIRPEQTSVNNFTAGRDTANFAAIRTDAEGKICVHTTSTSRLIWDQSGHTTDISGHTPKRLGDTRVNEGPPVPAGSVWRLNVGAPNQAVMGNLTVVSPEQKMFTTLYSCSATMPLASHNFTYAWETRPAFGVVRADAQGDICVYTTATTHLVWDQSVDSELISAHEPVRTLDTRSTRVW